MNEIFTNIQMQLKEELDEKCNQLLTQIGKDNKTVLYNYRVYYYGFNQIVSYELEDVTNKVVLKYQKDDKDILEVKKEDTVVLSINISKNKNQYDFEGFINSDKKYDFTGRHVLIAEDVALNDIVIGRDGPLHVTRFHNYVNGEFLNSYTADGIIIATATGSTGYSLSAGGPIVSPETNILIMTPVAPHTLNTRSVIFPAEDEITVEIGEGSQGCEAKAQVG